MRVNGGATHARVLDALEAQYPVLQGTIRDHGTFKRRPFVRFFACERGSSRSMRRTRRCREPLTGEEPFLVIGAIAGGQFTSGVRTPVLALRTPSFASEAVVT